MTPKTGKRQLSSFRPARSGGRSWVERGRSHFSATLSGARQEWSSPSYYSDVALEPEADWRLSGRTMRNKIFVPQRWISAYVLIVLTASR